MHQKRFVVLVRCHEQMDLMGFWQEGNPWSQIGWEVFEELGGEGKGGWEAQGVNMKPLFLWLC